MMIPSLLLKKLYTLGSLKNTPGGAQFAIKNRLSDAEIVGVTGIAINGVPVALERVLFDLGDGRAMPVSQVDAAHPFPFPLRSIVTIQTDVPHLAKGKHQIETPKPQNPYFNMNNNFIERENRILKYIVYISICLSIY